MTAPAGLAGHDPAYLRFVWLVASACGAAVLLGLAVLFHRARRRAELEEAERILAEDDAATSRPHHVSSRHG